MSRTMMMMVVMMASVISNNTVLLGDLEIFNLNITSYIDH